MATYARSVHGTVHARHMSIRARRVHGDDEGVQDKNVRDEREKNIFWRIADPRLGKVSAGVACGRRRPLAKALVDDRL